MRMSFIADRRGVAAMEFGLIAPVMVIMVMGMFDVTQALLAYNRVGEAALETGSLATAIAYKAINNTLDLEPTEAYQAATVIFGQFPDLKVNPRNIPYSVTLTSVYYIGTPSGCTPATCTSYTANVAWSVALTNGNPAALVGGTPSGPPQRACGTLTQIPPTASPPLTALPLVGMQMPGPINASLVVDVSYQFKPVFGRFITGPLTMSRTSLIPPRPSNSNSPYTYYDAIGNPSGDPAVCPGYHYPYPS